MTRAVAAILAAGIMLAGAGAGAAQTGRTDDARAAFVSAVQRYQGFVVPRCAPETVRAYTRLNRMRDIAFSTSLRGTPLMAMRRTAVREQAERDEHVVVHCDGPPPPPDPGAPTLTARQRGIAIEQERLRRTAADLPAFFDAGDVAFAQMVAARDALLARKDP